MKISSKRYYGSTCHIVEFLPSEIRLEDTPGIPGKREHISKIFGDPHLDEVTWLRVNRAFFDTQNSKSESMGDALGDAFINCGYKNGRLYFEPDIPANPEWNVGTSYMLLRGGEYSFDNEDRFKDILGKNPRTFFGQKPDGTIVFIAADGRRWPLEQGLSSNEQRAVAKSENLQDAANLDGGGSSVVMVGDNIINKSYDGRSLGNIFVGYRKYTQGELPTLKKGSKGVWVNLLQRLLLHHGYNCGSTGADGDFGANTYNAVIAFQRARGLAVDGIVGPKTWTELVKFQQPAKKLPDNLIAIDPGHGGSEWGGGSWFGYREKDLNLVEALRVAELLKEYNPYLVRTEDITMPVSQHAAVVKNKFKFCISIHHNAMADGTLVKDFGHGNTASGCYIFISRFAGEAMKKLAEYVGKAMEEIAGLKYMGAKTRVTSEGKDYYSMHSGTGSTGTLIVEPLFIDNPDELQKLNIEKISQAYAQGFKKFIQEYYIKTI